MSYIDWKEFKSGAFFFLRSATEDIRKMAKGNTLGAWVCAAFIALWYPIYIFMDLVSLPLILVFHCLKFGSRRKWKFGSFQK
jgi:hypothetical protein